MNILKESGSTRGAAWITRSNRVSRPSSAYPVSCALSSPDGCGSAGSFAAGTDRENSTEGLASRGERLGSARDARGEFYGLAGAELNYSRGAPMLDGRIQAATHQLWRVPKCQLDYGSSR